jgi:hypothetical protein
LVAIACAALIIINRQFIRDWLTVQSFTPTSEISSVADRSGMNDRGRFLFYTSRPQISSAAQFNTECERREATSAILGCYSDGSIFLFRVDNAELDGVIEVTAAHEMLHAVWDRLSNSEKATLTEHISAVYDKVKTPELEQRVAYYDRTQPGDRANELHSILATEFSTLDPTLEAHYKQYFTDRQKVVALHTKYAAVFAQLKQQADALKEKIDTATRQLNSDIAAYNTAAETLSQQITNHNASAGSVDRTNPAAVAAFNATRARLQQERASLTETQNALNERIAAHNEDIKQYNALALRSEQLTSSLDSIQSQ